MYETDSDLLSQEVDRHLIRSEVEELTNKARHRFLGNVKFIGELFKHGILSVDIIHSCIKTMLLDEQEDSLEALCKMLQTVGKKMDSEQHKVSTTHAHKDILNLNKFCFSFL